MNRLLLDTDALSWVLLGDAMPEDARARITAADSVHVSAISIYEIALKVWIGEWPEMARLVPMLTDLVQRSGIVVEPVSGAVAHAAGTMDWDHRDPFDRIVVAQAMTMACPILSSDRAIADLVRRPGRGLAQ